MASLSIPTPRDTSQGAAEPFKTILDFLHDDVPSLCECSLVHSSWNTIATFHKFHTLSVGLEWHARALTDITAATWIDRLAQSPAVAMSVVYLHFDAHTTLTPPSSTMAIPKLLSMLPNLRGLQFSYMDWRTFQPLQHCIRSTLPSLYRLDMHSCHFATFLEFSDLVRQCKSLDALHLSNMIFHTHESAEQVRPVEPERDSVLPLTSLRLDTENASRIFAWMAHPTCPIDIAKLQRLHLGPSSAVHVISTLLAAAGRSLRYLEVHTPSVQWNSKHGFTKFKSSIDFHMTTVLQHLRLSHMAKTVQSTPVPAILYILEQLLEPTGSPGSSGVPPCFSTLAIIELHMVCASPNSAFFVQWGDWSEVNAFLERVNPPMLRKVVVEMDDMLYREESEAELRRHLPWLSRPSHNILEVKRSSS